MLLIYGAPAPDAARAALGRSEWRRRPGRSAKPMDAWDVRIAPDGRTRRGRPIDPQLGTLGIWAYDGDRPLPRRISPAIDADESPVWSTRRHAARLGHGPPDDHGARRAGQLPDEQSLRTFEHPMRVRDWSPDGQWLVVSETRAGHARRPVAGARAATGERARRVRAIRPSTRPRRSVSPDGRWLAYASDESGRFEIYVDSFPNARHRAARLTSGGGTDPRWRRDGTRALLPPRLRDSRRRSSRGEPMDRPEASSSRRGCSTPVARHSRSMTSRADGSAFSST